MPAVTRLGATGALAVSPARAATIFQASEVVEETGEGSFGLRLQAKVTGSAPTAALAREITPSELSPGAMR